MVTRIFVCNRTQSIYFTTNKAFILIDNEVYRTPLTDINFTKEVSINLGNIVNSFIIVNDSYVIATSDGLYTKRTYEDTYTLFVRYKNVKPGKGSYIYEDYLIHGLRLKMPPVEIYPLSYGDRRSPPQ